MHRLGVGGSSGQLVITSACYALQHAFKKVLPLGKDYYRPSSADMLWQGCTAGEKTVPRSLIFPILNRFLALEILDPDTFVLEVAESKWMLFPYEIRETTNRLIDFADLQHATWKTLISLHLAIKKVDALLTVVGRGNREAAAWLRNLRYPVQLLVACQAAESRKSRRWNMRVTLNTVVVTGMVAGIALEAWFLF